MGGTVWGVVGVWGVVFGVVVGVWGVVFGVVVGVWWVVFGVVVGVWGVLFGAVVGVWVWGVRGVEVCLLYHRGYPYQLLL